MYIICICICTYCLAANHQQKATQWYIGLSFGSEEEKVDTHGSRARENKPNQFHFNKSKKFFLMFYHLLLGCQLDISTPSISPSFSPSVLPFILLPTQLLLLLLTQDLLMVPLAGSTPVECEDVCSAHGAVAQHLHLLPEESLPYIKGPDWLQTVPPPHQLPTCSGFWAACRGR